MAKRAVAWLVGLAAVAALLAPGATAGKPVLERFDIDEALLAPGATAGKPVLERFDIDETAPDPFLTAACGVPVTTQAEGHVIVRTFTGGGAGPVVVRTLNIALTATAGDNVVRFRDVGADVERIEPDGTAILMIIGQVPFDFTGLLKIDLETGDAILEPQRSTEEDLEAACATLTA